MAGCLSFASLCEPGARFAVEEGVERVMRPLVRRRWCGGREPRNVTSAWYAHQWWKRREFGRWLRRSTRRATHEGYGSSHRVTEEAATEGPEVASIHAEDGVALHEGAALGCAIDYDILGMQPADDRTIPTKQCFHLEPHS